MLKPFIAETLGIPKSDDAESEKRIDHIDVLSASEMVFHFKDGGTVGRTWVQPKRVVGRPWTDEQRTKFKESIKGAYIGLFGVVVHILNLDLVDASYRNTLHLAASEGIKSLAFSAFRQMQLLHP